MTDNNNDGAVPAVPGLSDPNATASQLALQAVYLKDCSYEAPNGPRVDGQWNPQINLDLHTGVSALTPEMREIVLTVTVSAKQGEATLFLVEVKQAGAFLMRNLSDENARRAIGTICMNVLFPFARAAVVEPRHPRRLSAVSAAPGEFRGPVRAPAGGRSQSGARHQELIRGGRTGFAADRIADRGARRGVLGNRARDPVCPQRQGHAAMGARPRAGGRDGPGARKPALPAHR